MTAKEKAAWMVFEALKLGCDKSVLKKAKEDSMLTVDDMIRSETSFSYKQHLRMVKSEIEKL